MLDLDGWDWRGRGVEVMGMWDGGFLLEFKIGPSDGGRSSAVSEFLWWWGCLF